ncbi:MAG: CoA pyrophosphatase [Anaerolineaceae bacterium]|nr:CoA pyrophosphatase [Anaerolineaceae bacterium]
MNLNQIKKAVKGNTQEIILPDAPRFTAVLIPLVEIDGKIHVVFEIRGEGIAQADEVSFPGGHVEQGETAEHAAVRETCEELLISQEKVEILAPMHRMTDRGNLIIDSFLGVIHNYNGSYSKDEVSRIFTVSLDWLLEYEPEIYSAETALHPGDDFPFALIPGGRDYKFIYFPKRFFFYRTQNAVIWGLTAELLYHALHRLNR